MGNLNTWQKILIIIIVLFGLIQLYPVERTNPPVQGRPDWDSERTKELVHRSCVDCHSHETQWPWYAYVAPSSWLVVWDVKEGREHFNMSVPPFDHGEYAAEMVESGEMPLQRYQWMHEEANYTPEEKEQLIQGLNATFGSDGSDEEDDDHSDHEH